MNDNPYKVQELTAAERDAFLSGRVLGRKPNPKHRSMMLADGFELKGSFALTARDVRTGAVDWTHEQDNIITDWGRVTFWDNGWVNMRVGFAPAQETPNLLRSTIPCDGSQVVVYPSNMGGGVVTPSTYTKQWGPVTFGAANRTLGIIFLTWYAGTVIDANLGVVQAYSYALLTPPKTQTSVQTIEVIYKLAINPIY